jgi:hypothetical protein
MLHHCVSVNTRHGDSGGEADFTRSQTTLGLTVDAKALVVARVRWPKRAVEPNQFACSRLRWRSLADLLLTHLAFCIDNDRDEIRGEVTKSGARHC